MDGLFEPGDQQRGEAHEHDDFADRGLTAQVEPDPEHENRQHRQRGRRARDHRRHRPPGQHRDLGPEHLFAHLLHSQNFHLDAGEALHQGDVSERIGGALGHVGIVALDRALQSFALVDDQPDHRGKHGAQHDQHQAVAPVDEQRQWQQHDERNETGEVLAEERQPQAPERIGASHHHLHQPSGMRAGVVAQRQLQHVLEEHRAHHLVLAVRQPIGMQRHQRAADDDEEAEADPGADQHHQVLPGQLRDARLGIGEGIDDAAEQDRFHERRRGQR